MKILLEKNECILVEKYIDKNARYYPFDIISAKLVEVQPIEGKSKDNCECKQVGMPQLVLFRNLVSHIVDISSYGEMCRHSRDDNKITFDSLGVVINKFCYDSGLNILIRTASDGKSLIFDIYDPDKKCLIKRGLTVDQLVEYIDETNKRYENADNV